MNDPTEQFKADMQQVINEMTLQQAGQLVLIVARAFMEKRTAYTPHGSTLMRLSEPNLEKPDLVVAIGRDELAAPMSTAYDAMKAAFNIGPATVEGKYDAAPPDDDGK